MVMLAASVLLIIAALSTDVFVGSGAGNASVTSTLWRLQSCSNQSCSTLMLPDPTCTTLANYQRSAQAFGLASLFTSLGSLLTVVFSATQHTQIIALIISIVMLGIEASVLAAMHHSGSFSCAAENYASNMLQFSASMALFVCSFVNQLIAGFMLWGFNRLKRS
jgi:hypothetical protein